MPLNRWINDSNPLLDDEIEVEASGFSRDTGRGALTVRDNGYTVEASINGWREQAMQPPAVSVHVECEERIWDFSMNVGTCRRLILTDRPFPDNVLYVANKTARLSSEG